MSFKKYEQDNEKSNPLFDYEYKICLYFLNKIKIFQLKLNKEKIRKIKYKVKIDSKQIQNFKENMPDKINFKKIIDKLNIKFTKFNLNVKVDTSNVILTSGLVTLSSIIISILLGVMAKDYNKTKYSYKITPVYTNKNMVEIDFNCIINVKIVHIIYILYFFIRKRRDDKNERTSNRRSYDYSYE